MKVRNIHLLLAGSMLGSTVAAVAPAHAQAFYLQEQSVRGQGRAFSGEAADTGVDSLWWNPAAIAGMQGAEVAVNASAVLPRGEVVDKGTLILRPGQAPAPVGGNGTAHNPISNGVIPSGGAAWGNGRMAFGVSLTAPYNFTTTYDGTSWARYTAGRTRLRTIDIQPTVAFSPVPGIAIGAGVNVERVSASLGSYLPNLSPALPDGTQTLSGSGWDVGWSVGAQARSGIVSVGVAYKSSIRHNLNGSVVTAGLLGPLAGQNGTIPTTASFRTPWQLIGSVRVAVSPVLTLNGQVVRAGWGNFDVISLGAPINAALPEHYKDVTSVAFGVDYKLTPKLTLRAGVQHADTPTQDGQRDARVPDANRWNFSGGASVALSKAVTIDAAASYIKFDDATIDRTTAAYAGSAAQTPILVNGMLQNASAVVLSLGARVTF